MNLLNWLKKQSSRKSDAPCGKAPRNRKRLTLQMLEQRQLLAADAIGVVSSNGSWEIDNDRNGIADVDRRFGLNGDQFVSGNWTGSGDQMAVARPRPDGFLQWYLNTDADVSPVHEVDFLYGLANDIALAGDWDGNGTDNPVVVRKSASGGLDWYKDLNQDPNAELFQSFGLHGDIPVVGDWDNNGTDNVGVVRATSSGFLEWYMDSNGDSSPEVQRIFGLVGDTPVVGDWNGDGLIDIGVTRPVQVNGVTKLQWLLDTNGDPNPDLPAVTFGDVNDRPVTGRWQLSEVAVYSNNGATISNVLDGQSGTQSIKFGEPLTGESVLKTFTVRNTGNSPLTIRQFTVPNGFTVTEPLATTLQPGQQDEFTVSLNTSDPGTYGGNVRFLTNDGNESPFTFPINGVVKARIPQIQVVSSVDFGEVVQNSTGPERKITIKITNTGNSPLEYKTARFGDEYRIVSGGTGTIARGATQELVVRLLTTTIGSPVGRLIIRSNAVSTPVMRISLSGSIVAPNPLIEVKGKPTFGSVPLKTTGSIREQVFTVSNPGNVPLKFTATTSNDSFVIVSGKGTTVAPKATVLIVVRMRTNSIGAKSAKLMITSNATNTPTFSLSLSGTVTKRSSRIEVTGSGSFGSASLGTTGETVTREFVVTNTGTAQLTYSTAMSNSNFTIVSGGEATVPVNGVSKIVVRMNTSTAGSKSATLNITTNDPTKPKVAVAINGSVVAPEVNVTIGSKTLAPGEAGGLFFGATTSSSLTKTFVIRNSGAGDLIIKNASIVGSFTHNMPSTFTLASGQSRKISVTMKPASFGTKVGRLLFSTNDSDESSVKIELLGRYLPVPLTSPGNSNGQSVFTIDSYSSDTIFIDPPNGKTAFNTSYVINQGGTRTTHTGALTKLIIVSTEQPVIENWTGLTVQWRRPNGSLVTLPKMVNSI